MNLEKAANAFFNSFNSNHVLLYVGQGASDTDLRDYISKCMWSGIITSRRDAKLVEFFANEERDLVEYSSREAIPAKPLSRTKLPILRLYGTFGEQDDTEDLSWLNPHTDSEASDLYRARNFLEFLPEMLDYVNQLVVIGVDSDADWKIFGEFLNVILYQKVTNGSVSFWGMPTSVAEKHTAAFETLKKVAERKSFEVHTEGLADVIRIREQELQTISADMESVPENDTDIYYQEGVPVSITPSEMLVFKNVGTLLTERTINKIRPLGRVQSQQWFANFLENSTFLGPQWYGYLPKSEFYIKRSYEDALVKLVKSALSGHHINGGPAPDKPIILAGHPGSSKSITLGALAYHIYTQKTNPVIYISKDSFLSANVGNSVEELDTAMCIVESKADADPRLKNARILVIWDSSTFKDGTGQAKSLLDALRNRGRRVVLVCSSYVYNGMDENADYYCLPESKGVFQLCQRHEAQVYERPEFFGVKAIREINEKETVLFWQRVKEYSGINDAMISQMKQKLQREQRHEIFDYYYLLISKLRENLEKSLESEQSKVCSYVEKKLRKVIGEIHANEEEQKKKNPMYLALLAAGLDVDDLSSDEDEAVAAGDEELDKKLDLFNMCVALFSRFKLSVPYNLVYTLLLGDSREDQYSANSRDIYNIVTTEIPWIHYGEDASGNFSFRFRNPLEADIFLRNHDFSGEQQIELVSRIIDIYGKDYQRSRCKDQVFTENLQALLRQIGPNTGYAPFLTAARKDEHDSLLRHLNVLIGKIKELQEHYGVPDDDAGFATIVVTFTREYYGAIWDKLYFSPTASDVEKWEYDPEHYCEEWYEFRIRQMSNAIALAERSVEGLEIAEHSAHIYERQHLRNQRSSLAVEIALCNMRAEDIIDEYKRCCAAHGTMPKAELISGKLSYQLLYLQLWQVISGNPVNGYAYNALFRAFERMYERESMDEQQKLKHLSEIMQVVDFCESLDSEIVNRGSNGVDELTAHINQIKDYSTGLQISLESIYRHRRKEPARNEDEQHCFEVYDAMLKANNAAAITFVCRKELNDITGVRRLNTDQQLRCRTVYNFMREADNYECICANTYAMAMLIRVYWMCCNGTTLTATPECQVTRLTMAEWRELNNLCRIYEGCAGENRQPLIVLLYALSALQISNLAEYGYTKALDILDTLSETAFYQKRMWTPFMVCNENGEPVTYSGTVISTKDNGGFIHVHGVPRNLKSNVGVRFRQYNLGRNARMPEPNQVLTGLELGLGYTSFSVYNDTGRREREGKA